MYVKWKARTQKLDILLKWMNPFLNHRVHTEIENFNSIFLLIQPNLMLEKRQVLINQNCYKEVNLVS